MSECNDDFWEELKTLIFLTLKQHFLPREDQMLLNVLHVKFASKHLRSSYPLKVLKTDSEDHTCDLLPHTTSSSIGFVQHSPKIAEDKRPENFAERRKEEKLSRSVSTP